MKNVISLLFLVIIMALSFGIGYYWGLGVGMARGYDRACNSPSYELGERR